MLLQIRSGVDGAFQKRPVVTAEGAAVRPAEEAAAQQVEHAAAEAEFRQAADRQAVTAQVSRLEKCALKNMKKYIST